jgi:hypothetical protein
MIGIKPNFFLLEDVFERVLGDEGRNRSTYIAWRLRRTFFDELNFGRFFPSGFDRDGLPHASSGRPL